MRRRRFNWIWLVLGVLVISATCGFGYEARQTRTRFERAKDAFAVRDWDRVVECLSETSSPGRPSPKAFTSFLRTYVDPELASGKYELKHREVKSSMVPIQDETVTYQMSKGPPTAIISLRYVDDAVWFNVPFSSKRVGVFRGKLINLSFMSVFYRIAWTSYPQNDRRDIWKSVLAFVNSEKERLTEMGITPSNLYSQEKTWEEFSKEYEARIRKRLGSRGT
jgi:hypothetical protein